MIQSFNTTPLRPWTIVVPFKGSPAAKSRLATAHDSSPGINTHLRGQLARAFLHDTITAALAADSVGQLIVVSGDPTVALELPEVIVIPDPGQGLNAALLAGINHARSGYPYAPTAVLTGDLPGLATPDLQLALELAEEQPLSVVADHAGTGTTTLTALPGEELIPQFGKDSHLKHRRGGHRSLPIALDSTLRQDVDTPQDLRHAVSHGVGHATTNTLTQHSTPTHRSTLYLERTP